MPFPEDGALVALLVVRSHGLCSHTARNNDFGDGIAAQTVARMEAAGQALMFVFDTST